MIECMITSSVLIVVLIILRSLFRKKISCRLQYALWGMVLLRLLMPFPLIESPLSVMNAVANLQITGSLSDIQGYSDMIRNTEMSPDEARAAGSGTLHEIRGYSLESRNKDLRSYIFIDSPGVVPGRILGIVWLIGGIAVGLWFLGINLVFYRKLRKRRKARPDACCRLPVYIADGLASPCLFGLLHPSIYLTPQALEREDDIHYVLAHELCHYRHGDHIWSILRGLCIAAYWWNPLVWAAAILSREDSELACDETVIKRIGEENRLAYGHTLIDMIAVRKSPAGFICAATTMLSGKRGIKERLKMIIENPKAVVPAMVAVLLIVAVSAGCTFTGAKAVPLSAEEALEQLAASAYHTKNEVSFKIPEGYEKLEEWNIHLAGRLEFEDGFSQSIHHMDNINDARAWKPGERYSIALNDSYTELTLTASLPNGSGGIQEKTVDLLNTPAFTASYGLIPLVGGGDGTINVTTEVDCTNLDACVADAVLTANTDQYHSGDFAAEAHTVLKTLESGSTTTVYAVALYMEFGYGGSGFFETRGSHMPVAITFEKNAAGEYELKEYWTPQDGSRYASSIKEKFPSDIYEDALDTQKYVMTHIQACYAQAIEHGSVPVAGYLAKLVETICSSPYEESNPGAYIDAHPIEYREMIYYGNYTLRYCFTLFEQGGRTGLDGHIMASACRDILGETENIDLPANTGQDWYDAFKAFAEDLRRKNGDEYMKKNMPGSWLLLQMLDEYYQGIR